MAVVISQGSGGGVAALVDELTDRFAPPAPRGAGRKAERDRGATHLLLTGHAENLFHLIASFRGEPSDRRSHAVRPRSQHDAFGEPPFIEGLALRPFPWHDEQHGERRAAQVTDVTTQPGERFERLAIADDDDLAELAIARAARPAGDLEDVLDDVIGDRLALKRAHGAEAAQEIGELTGRSFDGHQDFSLSHLPFLSWFRKAPTFMLPPVPVRRR